VRNPPDYVQRLRALQPTLLWRNANLSPDFTAVAPVLEAMYSKATGQTVDGVIQIDSHGLAAILAGIGPVLVPQLGVVSADNAVALTLTEAYVRFPDRTVRQEYLGDVAEAAFRRLVSGEYPSLRPLATALVKTSEGRHILMHSRQRAAQRAVIRLGVEGSMPVPDVDFLALNVQNFAGNKLDYYLDSKVSVVGPRPADRPAHLRVTVDLANTAPVGGSPPYVFGPVDPSLKPGEYRGLVSVYLPRGTRLVGHSGGPVVGNPALASDGGRTVVSFGVSIPAGDRRRVTLEVGLPSRPRSGYTWEFVPVPRVRPTVAVLDLDTGGDHLRFDGELVRSVTVRGAS
jgi:hypothetical protein